MRSRSNHFGTYLREKRSASRKTLGDVARALNCSVSFVSDVEHGRRLPFDRDQIEKVAALLHVSVADMMVAAAKDRQAVVFTSDRDQDLEMAASFARVMGGADTKRKSELLALMDEFFGEEDVGA